VSKFTAASRGHPCDGTAFLYQVSNCEDPAWAKLQIL